MTYKNTRTFLLKKEWFCSEFHRFLCHSYLEEFEGENAAPLDSEEFIDIINFILCQDSQYHVSYLLMLQGWENNMEKTVNLTFLFLMYVLSIDQQ